MDAINKYLQRTLKTHIIGMGLVYQDVRPHVECADGFSISIQASEGHYCSPRVNGDCKYDSVELGYPNMVDPLIIDYAEDPESPKRTVYGYVPIEVVNKLIDKHGGIIN